MLFFCTISHYIDFFGLVWKNKFIIFFNFAGVSFTVSLLSVGRIFSYFSFDNLKYDSTLSFLSLLMFKKSNYSHAPPHHQLCTPERRKQARIMPTFLYSF